jgi:tetratricopeptide (TPR) repeat protein
MSRTEIKYGPDNRVQSIFIDGKEIDQYIGRPIALNLHNNNQEIVKAVSDTQNLINNFTDAMDLVFSEHPDVTDLKRYYEETINVTGLFLLRFGEYSGAEAIYHKMLEALQHFETYGRIHLHKGMSYHNIAISQFFQRNFDEAIANEFRAFREDLLGGTSPENSFALQVLGRNYTQPLIMIMTEAANPMFHNMMRKELSNEVIDLMSTLELGPRLFLLQILKSFEINRTRDNLYVRCRAFDNAKNLALVTETFLRNCCETTKNAIISADYIGKGKPMLKGLLEILFGKQPWFPEIEIGWQTWAQFDPSKIPHEIDSKVSSLLTKPLSQNVHDCLIRGVLLFGLIRNFTAHEFEPNCVLTDHLHEQAMSWMFATLLVLFSELRTSSII